MSSQEKDDLSTVRGRLLHFLKDRRMSQAELCKMLGVAPTYIGVMRKSMSPAKVQKLMELFPELSRDWVLYGEGEMYIEGKAAEAREVLGDEGFLAPLVPVSAFAGNLTAWAGNISRNECEMVLTPVRGVDFAVKISGDSMEPEFHNGAIIFIKMVEDTNFLPWGHPIAIDTKNGLFVKELFPSEKGKRYVSARSLNPKYPPIEMPCDSIYGYYRIRAQLSTYTSY